ncbi:hypothetical protein AYX07_08030 [Thermoactinomyces sp. AS95]|nr:hypothetical protein JS81_12130 [Thermoactinomyces sp. Gus2-1]KYQ87054.1 hypothetical protein AYX07_08030 [Thermoactinomyces sp. AS95]
MAQSLSKSVLILLSTLIPAEQAKSFPSEKNYPDRQAASGSESAYIKRSDPGRGGATPVAEIFPTGWSGPEICYYLYLY